MTSAVLLIDADPIVHKQVKRACRQIGVSLSTASGSDQALKVLDESPPDLVLLDVDQQDSAASTVFERFRRRWPRLCAILIAERTRSEEAIEAMKHGAIDYLLKPLDYAELVNRIENTLHISRDMSVPTIYERADHDDEPVARIIGQSPAMHEVFKLIGLIAPRDVNVLIIGESGTGKELIARAIYHHSQRKERPFVAVNCAAIPETLLESELFGHEKGAFTGAYARRIGRFEQCDGGTLFLDEIGDIPPTIQAKLLRVLQDGTFQRLGSTETFRCDVRILAATNQPVEQMVAEKKFRQDLFYRLNVASIALPPLREREVDVVLLAHEFVKRFNPLLGTQIVRFAPETLTALLSYSWPGNVRELENVIKASLVIARGTVFRLEFLPDKVRHAKRRTPSSDEGSAAAGDSLELLCRKLLAQEQYHGRLHQEAVKAAERAMISACLAQTAGRLAPAARLLGITRATLRKKMSQFGIHVSTSIHNESENDHSR